MPSLSALLGVGAATLFSVASATKYTVQDTYAGSSFFDNFNFVTEEKTNGFVKYVDRATAKSKGYISYVGDDAIFGVDYKSKLNSTNGVDVGRESVRLEGKKEYNKGLFVLDIKHMPGGICGTWPSFWALGREPWPVKGEIDIIEGVNKNSANNLVLHTDTNCKTDGKGQTGVQALKDCALDSSSGSTGCGVTDVSSKSFGTGFNTNNGGYYVTEWQAEGIKIWFFPRGSEPKSLTSSSPDTSEFGTPSANFQGDCDIEKRFMDQRFIFTNTFCGDWAGNVYAQSGCPMYSGLSGMASCKKYVAENPAVFKDAYWRVSSFKTYNKRATTSSSSVVPSSTPHASSSSSVHVSSSSIRVSSSSVHVSSSSVRVSSSSVVRSSSALSSSVVHSSSTPTSHVSSSIHTSTPATSSSSHPHDTSSSVAHDYSSTISASVSRRSYDYVSSSWIIHDYSSTFSSSASEAAYGHVSSSVFTPSASERPYSHDVSLTLSSTSAFETPYSHDSSNVYPSGIPKSPEASSKNFEYSVVSSLYPDASPRVPPYDNEYPVAPSKASGHDAYPTASIKTPEYNNYPSASSSAPVYGNDYPSYPVSSSVPAYNRYPVSTPVYADYAELPSFTPFHNTYPAISRMPSYGDDKKSYHSYKAITAYETTYVDVCPTGYTTITTKVTAIQTPAPYPTTNAYYAPPGFELTTKYCAQGCGSGPKTVTVTVPCSKCQVSTLVPNKPTSIPKKPTNNTPYIPSKPSTPEDSTTKITATKIVTLNKVPVPESQYYAAHPSIASASASLIRYPDADSGKGYDNSKPVAPTGSFGGEKAYPTGSAPAGKPVASTGSIVGDDKPAAPTGSPGGKKPYATGSAPAGKPVAPTGSVGGGKPVYPSVVGYQGSNITMSYGTATPAKGKPTQTGYKVPEFTGAASGLQVGGVVVGAVAVFAAMMM